MTYDFQNSDLQNVLRQINEFCSDNSFWQHPGQTLALFANRGGTKAFRLAIELDQLISVSDIFSLRPLLLARQQQRQFGILHLGLKNIYLLRCSQTVLENITPPSLPDILDKFLQLDGEEKALQFHTGSAVSNGKRPAVYHGQGAGEQKERHWQKMFRRAIDRRLAQIPELKGMDLLLAGNERLIAEFRRESGNPCLLPQGLNSDLSHSSPENFHNLALSLASNIHEKNLLAWQRVYRKHAARKKVSDELEVIIQAAYRGLIRALRVSSNAHIWGFYDPDRSEMHIHENRRPEDVDLLELAVHYVLQSGADVIVSPENAGTASVASAVFRAPLAEIGARVIIEKQQAARAG